MQFSCCKGANRVKLFLKSHLDIKYLLYHVDSNSGEFLETLVVIQYPV